jgi:YD repeat-containing protein
LKRPTYELEDAFQRVIKREVLENNSSFSCMQFNYDAEGNPTKEEATVLVNGQPKREYGIIRTYNNRGLLESETEIPNGKITRFQYDAMGRLQHKQKPDGVFLHHVYDALGRLQALASSDHTVAYSYTYDLHDHLIQVYDHVHAITQKRTYDAWDHLLTEELGPDVIIHYEYDILDRLIRMVLPDDSSVQYIYDAFHLKKINRCNAASQVIYTYECTHYDMQGHLLASKSPGGKVNYTYDALGRSVGIQGNQ